MKRPFILLGGIFPLIGLVFLMQTLQSFANTVASNDDGEFTVNSTLDAVDINIGDGVCETGVGNNVCTLRAAIQETNALVGANVIHIPSGIYTLTIAGNDEIGAVGDLDITDSLSIIGEDNSTTTIDGNELDRVFDVRWNGGMKVVVEDISIQNGKTFASGGGICNCSPDSSLILNRVTIRNNIARSSGGGIHTIGTLEVVESLIQGNGGVFAGGGISSEGVANIKRTVILSNTAPSDGLGGGIYNLGVMHVENSTIRGNSVYIDSMGSNGGGIFNQGEDAEIFVENSTISHNTAQPSFGGFVNWGGTAWLTNSTVSDNEQGGILQYSGGNLYITNTTVISNVHDKVEPIWHVSLRVQEGSVSIVNSIIAGDTSANNCIGTINSIGNNLDSGSSCGFSSSGDLSNVDPLVGLLQWNGGDTETYALLAGSPAIDAGNDVTCASTDQRGAPRPGGIHCDIGAFEYYVGPVALDDEVSNPDKIPMVINVLANDLPSDDGLPQLESVDSPMNGTAVISGTTIYYTPPAEFMGKDVFSYTISDGVLTDTAIVTVTVGPILEYRIYLPTILKPTE